jgi:hypothetical protein
MLALRMDFSAHRGFASTATLMADADTGERIVRQATSWARKTGFLEMTRRGHRIDNERVTASEWKLLLPNRHAGGPNRHADAARGGPNRHVATTQPARGTAPSSSRPSLSKLGVFAIGEVLRLTGKTITEDEAERAIKIKLNGKHPNYPQKYLAKIIADDPQWWLPTPMPPRFTRPEYMERK